MLWSGNQLIFHASSLIRIYNLTNDKSEEGKQDRLKTLTKIVLCTVAVKYSSESNVSTKNAERLFAAVGARVGDPLT